MAKTPKLTAEERLAKVLDNQAALEAELQLVWPAKLWPFIETMARGFLDRPNGREWVAGFALACRQEAMARFGHDTLETFALAKLLRDGAQGWQPKPPRLDAISYINSASHKPNRLSAEQDSAATAILSVWRAFGKFLEIGGRGIGGGGSSRTSALGPMDVMGEELWAHHKTVYTPWYEKASRTVVERRTSTGNHLTIAAVVFKVLVEDVYPEQLDTNHALIKGTSLRALKAGLNAYEAPNKLDRWGKPPASPPPAPKEGGLQAQTGVGGSTDHGQGADATPAPAKRPPGLWQPPRPNLPPDGKVKLAPRKKIATRD